MRRALGLVMVAALALAGCQGEGDTPGTSTDVPTSTGQTSSPEPTTSTGETGTPSETATASESGTASETSSGTETPSGTGQATETEAPVDVPWADGAVQEDVMDSGGETQEVTGVRTGLHEGYDRVVLDLSGDERLLGWGADYVDEAVEDPTGFPLEVKGAAYLQIGVRGIDWTTESEERYDGETVVGAGTEVVTEVVFGGLFEGQQQVVIGLREQAPYRIFGLDDPARIVIDVQHP